MSNIIRNINTSSYQGPNTNSSCRQYVYTVVMSLFKYNESLYGSFSLYYNGQKILSTIHSIHSLMSSNWITEICFQIKIRKISVVAFMKV